MTGLTFQLHFRFGPSESLPRFPAKSNAKNAFRITRFVLIAPLSLAISCHRDYCNKRVIHVDFQSCWEIDGFLSLFACSQCTNCIIVGVKSFLIRIRTRKHAVEFDRLCIHSYVACRKGIRAHKPFNLIHKQRWQCFHKCRDKVPPLTPLDTQVIP